MMASVKGISGAKENEDGSITITGASAWAWGGMWLGDFDASAFSHAVLELAQPADFTVQLVVQHKEGEDVSGQIPAGETLLKLKLSETGKGHITQMALQNAAPGSFTVKALYFATQEYVDNMAKATTKNLSLSNLESGWNADYDAASHTISVTGEEGGKGWWLGSADFSDFDNVVVEFDPAVTADWGKVVVQYVAEGVASSEVEFYKGATCVVVPMDAANKNAVMQIYIQGNNGANFTLKAAYLAVASATPEANPGTTGISTVNAAMQQNGVRYNLAGQKVSDSYKGLVIMNGKKAVMK
jgi:hypothetical protein